MPAHTRSVPSGLLHELLQLLDGSVQQHLGGAVGAAERPRDLAVVHPEREAHDQRLAAVVRQVLDTLEDPLQVVAVLDQRLGRVGGGDRARVVDRRLRLARAVAVVVGRQVVRDPDQPRPQRAPLRLALRALEVPVGLQERLLREVLGVVVVAHPVVRVRVDVAQVRLVERGELGVEARLGRGFRPPCIAGYAARTFCGRFGRRSRRGERLGPLRRVELALDHAGQPAQRRRVDAGGLHALGEQRHARDGLGGLAERRVDVLGRHALGEHLAGAAVARALGHARWRRGRRRRPGRRTSRARSPRGGRARRSRRTPCRPRRRPRWARRRRRPRRRARRRSWRSRRARRRRRRACSRRRSRRRSARW